MIYIIILFYYYIICLNVQLKLNYWSGQISTVKICHTNSNYFFIILVRNKYKKTWAHLNCTTIKFSTFYSGLMNYLFNFL